MIERIGEEQLLSLLLARAPDRALDAIVTPSPDDTADLVGLREGLARLAMEVDPVAPPPRLLERILAKKPKPLRPVRPVLLVLDMIVDHLAEGKALEVPRARAIVPAMKRRLDEARATSIPVVYVCDHHKPDDPDFEVWPLHALEGTEGAEVWPALAPERGDHVIKKPTYSAFNRSDLGALLTELGADEIILTGCATELGLHATAVDALQRGYVVTVPPDAHAGNSAIGEQVALLTLSVMPPYDPLYVRRGRAR